MSHILWWIYKKENSWCWYPLDLHDISADIFSSRHMNVDYAVCEALKYQTDNLPGSIVYYDVACGWIVHFLERVMEGQYLELPEGMKDMIGAVGKFHLNAHVQECFAKYSPNFILGAGQVDGEIIETLWSVFNKVSGTARTMSHSHRREVYDDFMRDSNWKKLVGMGEFDHFLMSDGNISLRFVYIVKSLLGKYKKAMAGLHKTQEAFEGLTKSISADLIEQWTAAENKAMLEHGNALEIFNVKEENSESNNRKSYIY